MGYSRLSLGIKHGFTLVELIVVVAILAVLSALLQPVFVRARKSALANTGRMNMRQSGLSLILYMDDHSAWDSPPLIPVASRAVPIQTACIPLDNWHDPCRRDVIDKPMIGSFGYVPEIISYSFSDPVFEHPFPNEWQTIMRDCKARALLVNPFDPDVPTCAWFAKDTGLSGDPSEFIAWKIACSRAKKLMDMPKTTEFLDTEGALHTFRIPLALATWQVWYIKYSKQNCPQSN